MPGAPVDCCTQRLQSGHRVLQDGALDVMPNADNAHLQQFT